MIRDTHPRHPGARQQQAAPLHIPDQIESFICILDDGWYVEYSDGESGPFASLREAQDYWKTHPQSAGT